MHLWSWIRHPRLSLYIKLRELDLVEQNLAKENRARSLDLYHREPYVDDFCVSLQSLVYEQNVWAP